MSEPVSFLYSLARMAHDIKGLNNLYQLIVDERIEDTKIDRYKNLVEERIKKFKNGKISSTYNKKFLEYYNRYQSKRYKTDIRFKLNRNISRLIRKSLKSNKDSRHWEELVGYTVNELKIHLQNNMPKGYAWQDYLEGRLHLDHKIPIDAFNFDSSEQIDFKRCWNLKNLQLLPARENIIKSNKLEESFQPALKI